jgi:ElaB/YqjD/DUF883 family membrane-anchored ribosome-binding protein
MGHHLAGTSNSARRRAAVAAEIQATPEESTGILPTVNKTASEAFQAVQSRFGNWCCTAMESLKHGKETVAAMEHAVEEKIQHRPVTSVLAALGIGLLVGIVSTMACKRKSC